MRALSANAELRCCHDRRAWFGRDLLGWPRVVASLGCAVWLQLAPVSASSAQEIKSTKMEDPFKLLLLLSSSTFTPTLLVSQCEGVLNVPTFKTRGTQGTSGTLCPQLGFVGLKTNDDPPVVMEVGRDAERTSLFESGYVAPVEVELVTTFASTADEAGQMLGNREKSWKFIGAIVVEKWKQWLVVNLSSGTQHWRGS